MGTVVSDKASISFTGKGVANYGKIQQENIMKVMENFADGVAPLYPTMGQQWYNSTTGVTKVCTGVNAGVATWRSLGGVQVTGIDESAPVTASVGDLWIQGQRSLASSNPLPAATGTTYVYTGFGRHPQTAGDKLGGWNQIWPQIETVAGRAEYTILETIVNQLVGPTSVGGNGAIGTVLPQLTNFTSLDQDLRARFSAMPVKDRSMLEPINDSQNEMFVDTTSQDWDVLLAAARYAVSRLDMPVDMVLDVSEMPFVSDGRPAPIWMTSLPTNHILYPTLSRRSNRRYGTATLSRAYTETINVLQAAIQNRYAIRGINGSSGVSPAYASTTSAQLHRAFSGDAGGNATANVTLAFNFANAEQMQSFLNSGGNIEFTLSHRPNAQPATAGDTAMRALTDQQGVVRFAADKVRTFSSAVPRYLSATPSTTGLKALTTTPSVLAQKTVNGATYTITGQLVSPIRFTISVNAVAPSGMNGTMTFDFGVIKDVSQYINQGVQQFAFGAPLAFATGDKTGGSAWLSS